MASNSTGTTDNVGGTGIPDVTLSEHNLLCSVSDVDDNVLIQARQLAGLPFIFPHVALKSDAHFGKGSSVGTVFGTETADIPAAVGVDIGCGTIGVCTSFTAADLVDHDFVDLQDAIERSISLSPGRYHGWVLGGLAEGTPQFDSYLRDPPCARRFTWLNREEMTDRFPTLFGEWVGEQVTETGRINCHHSYTVKEQYHGKTVWLIRKVAVKVDAGVKALIPGSMGTASHVMEGRGFASGLRSAPHEAGRRFSRTEAREPSTADDLEERMGGIVHRPGDALVDEIPDVYKDIDVVMADAEPLVEVLHRLRQVMNVKGR